MFSTFDLCLLLYVIRLAGWLKHCNLSLSAVTLCSMLQTSLTAAGAVWWKGQQWKHAMVSHDTYCQKLLESDTLDPETFQEVLSTLLPSAQLTFGACLARLATHHWDLAATKAKESTVFSKESAPRGVVEPGSRLVYQDTLLAICSQIQEAVLVRSLFIHLGHASCPPHSCLCVAQHTLASFVLLFTNFKCLLLDFVNAHPAALSCSAMSNIPHTCAFIWNNFSWRLPFLLAKQQWWWHSDTNTNESSDAVLIVTGNCQTSYKF